MKLNLLLLFCCLNFICFGQENNVKLNQPFTLPFTNVIDFQMNAEYVIYRTDHEKFGKYELYSIPINGGDVVKLNPPIDDELGKVCSYTIVDNKVYYTTRLDLTKNTNCLLYTSPSPRDATLSRMPSSA